MTQQPQMFLERNKTGQGTAVVGRIPAPSAEPSGLTVPRISRGEVYEFIGRQNLVGPIAIEFNGNDRAELTVKVEGRDQVVLWAAVFDIRAVMSRSTGEFDLTEGATTNWRGYQVRVIALRWLDPRGIQRKVGES